MTKMATWPEFEWIPFARDLGRPHRETSRPIPNQIVWITNGSLVVPAICGDVWHDQRVIGDIYDWRWRYNFRFPWVKDPWCGPADLAPDMSLDQCPRKLLEILIDRGYENPISRSQLGEESGYPAGVSTFSNGLSRLRTLGLIEENASMIRVASEMIDE